MTWSQHVCEACRCVAVRILGAVHRAHGPDVNKGVQGEAHLDGDVPLAHCQLSPGEIELLSIAGVLRPAFNAMWVGREWVSRVSESKRAPTRSCFTAQELHQDQATPLTREPHAASKHVPALRCGAVAGGAAEQPAVGIWHSRLGGQVARVQHLRVQCSVICRQSRGVCVREGHIVLAA
jgi:hypothetical protein